MIILKTSATISNDFANVIKSGKYEEIIYELMCRSEIVFPSKYQYNQEQAHYLADRGYAGHGFRVYAGGCKPGAGFTG